MFYERKRVSVWIWFVVGCLVGIALLFWFRVFDNDQRAISVKDIDQNAVSPSSDAVVIEGPRPLQEGFLGVVCFRGNAQRNYYGEGPIPAGSLRVVWRAAIGSNPVESRWSGVGWTGQPLIVDWPESVLQHMEFIGVPPSREVIQGALDGRVHFFNAVTGDRTRQPLSMPSYNPIKGTLSIDPRGYPILYVGTGLNRAGAGHRAYSLINYQELLHLPGSDAKAPRRWVGFDSNALVLDDTLYVVGENGLFYKVKLNTSFDPENGKLSLSPSIEKQVITSAGVESSIAVFDNHAYFGDNYGGVWRVRLSNPSDHQKLLDLGDDSDSTCTFDDEGYFYTGIEVDRRRSGRPKGVVYKIRARDGKVMWKWEFSASSIYQREGGNPINGGLVSTPAVWSQGGMLFITTTHHPVIGSGYLVGLDIETGRAVWTKRMLGYGWSSPIVIGERVLAIDSNSHVWVRDAKTGKSLLTDDSGNSTESYFLDSGTIEASPIVFEGKIYVASRGGALMCIASKTEKDL